MNIFTSDECPVQSAKWLDNKRVVKQTLESAQLLSTALRINKYAGDKIYKISYQNHPSSLWTRRTRGNYLWLLNHFKALCGEYTRRFGKVHKSESLLQTFVDNIDLIDEGPQEEFSNNARNLSKGVDFSHIQPVTDAYKLYLSARWESDIREPVWS